MNDLTLYYTANFKSAECEEYCFILYSTYLLSQRLSSDGILIFKVLFCFDPYCFMELILYSWSCGYSHCLLIVTSWDLTCSALPPIDLYAPKLCPCSLTSNPVHYQSARNHLWSFISCVRYSFFNVVNEIKIASISRMSFQLLELHCTD